MRIFVTGGAGYVGSHCVRHLLAHGHEVVVYDNLSYGHRASVPPGAQFIRGDLADGELLATTLCGARVDAVMHFAAYAYVGESVHEPLKYYRNNVANTMNLLEKMQAAGIRKLVFSSTCATYGEPDRVPITEDTAQRPINPYGRSKLMVEWMLRDSVAAWGLGACALRYFNACGAAGDGSIGEDHRPETHLIPLVLQVALGQRDKISIFGNDYDTPDGTCVRDYIHVDDLASAHRLAIEAIQSGMFQAYNIGTGLGNSVREIVEAARRVTGQKISAVDHPRRPGDPPILVADSQRLCEGLDWKPVYTDIEKIVASAWRWHNTHPQGFGDH